jgi:hypothetical protein
MSLPDLPYHEHGCGVFIEAGRNKVMGMAVTVVECCSKKNMYSTLDAASGERPTAVWIQN